MTGGPVGGATNDEAVAGSVTTGGEVAADAETT
jgi:hypothetical protein